MARSIKSYLKESAEVIELTSKTLSNDEMENAITICVDAVMHNKPLLVCGNGGSAADAMHISGELVARFLLDRKAINCMCLSLNPAMVTAWSNDCGYETTFSRQVEAHGVKGGVLIGISTSGTSKNVIMAAEKAKSMGMKVIGMTGEGGAKMAELSDALLDAASVHTPMIQQAHACLYHYLCEEIEARVTKARGE